MQKKLKLSQFAQLTESQCIGYFDLLRLFQVSSNHKLTHQLKFQSCYVNGGRLKFPSHCSTTALDVLWGQPIKLIQVVSTSEFHEY